MFVISTGVDKVAINFGKPDQKLHRPDDRGRGGTVPEGRPVPGGQHGAEDRGRHLIPPNGGKKVIITQPHLLEDAIHGRTGTESLLSRASTSRDEMRDHELQWLQVFLLLAPSRSSSFAGYACPVVRRESGGHLRLRRSLRESSARALHKTAAGRDDIFRYARLLPVTRLDLASPLRVGMTPLYHADRLGAAAGLKNLYLKDDGQNPSASFKDRAGAVALVRARETGAKVIAGASTGNAGSSMACLAASVGDALRDLRSGEGARGEDRPAAGVRREGAGRARHVRRRVRPVHEGLRASAAGSTGTRGYNPFTREGKKTCSFEICEQLGGTRRTGWSCPRATATSSAASGRACATCRRSGMIDRLPKIDCAQSEESAAIAQAVCETAKLET